MSLIFTSFPTLACSFSSGFKGFAGFLLLDISKKNTQQQWNYIPTYKTKLPTTLLKLMFTIIVFTLVQFLQTLNMKIDVVDLLK